MEAADVRPSFYNENEDAISAKPRWFIEIGNAEILISDQFNFEESGKRVIFQGREDIWAIRFPNAASYQDFYRKYNDKLFENTYQVQNDDANRQKVLLGCNSSIKERCSLEKLLIEKPEISQTIGMQKLLSIQCRLPPLEHFCARNFLRGYAGHTSHKR